MSLHDEVKGLPPHLKMAVLKGQIEAPLAKQFHGEYPWMPWGVAERLIVGTTTEADHHFIEVMSKLAPDEARQVIDEYHWLPRGLLARMINGTETEEDRAYVREYGKTVTPSNTSGRNYRTRGGFPNWRNSDSLGTEVPGGVTVWSKRLRSRVWTDRRRICGNLP